LINFAEETLLNLIYNVQFVGNDRIIDRKCTILRTRHITQRVSRW